MSAFVYFSGKESDLVRNGFGCDYAQSAKSSKQCIEAEKQICL